jgi:diadenosine tetraphosphate (Ap4A) HIT family hydrolase
VARIPINWVTVRETLHGHCFICELQTGTPGFEHDVIGEYDGAIVFLSKYPSLFGHVLVAPTAHREAVTEDFDLDTYLRLQSVVYRVAEALRVEVATERMYILSLGSQQGNSHVHWHIVPLPPGVPIEEQQFKALDREDMIDMPRVDTAALVERLRRRLGRPDRHPPDRAHA